MKLRGICGIFEGGEKKRGARGNCLIRLTQYLPLVATSNRKIVINLEINLKLNQFVVQHFFS